MVDLASPEPYVPRHRRNTSGSGNFERRATTLTEDLEELERTDPEVKRAKKRLDDTMERMSGKGPALSFDEIHNIYGDQKWRGYEKQQTGAG